MKPAGRVVQTAPHGGGAVHVHAPKFERFDLVERTNTDPKGFVREVEEFRKTPWGLYMARTADHPRFHYLESWLIPSLGMRASVFHQHAYNDTHKVFYLDLGEYTPGQREWTSLDHYVDLVVRNGRSVEVLDVDELLAARTAGLIDAAVAETTLTNAFAAVDGLASHGYRLSSWLGSLDMEITWH